MRTADQIKRKYNELAVRKRQLEEAANADGGEASASAREMIARLEEQMLLLEWVLNEPVGSYHV
ncbi:MULTISPECIES: hypothetical protein [Cohnella]|jgi:hypothetical protein|uniref:hypothetical protein n=1 Tax=Cohnella TaxID=329857 RepID=UPI00036E1C33|nr:MULTISPECIES: hypothetical protein [Cohnella]REK67176.1 MAG: hypothetical protein C6P35_06215 [Cohnella sp.]